MNCNICKSGRITKLDDFKPYTDKNWTFEIYECLDCKTRFAVRDSSINYHEEIHTSKNSPYDFHYKSAEIVKEFLNTDIVKCQVFLGDRSVVLSDLFDYVKDKPKHISILEIGCSTGYVTALMQKMGFTNSRGIDISETVINYANSMFGDFYSLKAEEKKYDIIFHTGLIGCVDEPIEFLNYYLNYLKNDGIMLFNAPNVDSVVEINELWVSTPPPDLIYLFKDKSIENSLGNSYNIKIKKTFTPVNILMKYMNRYKKKKNNSYPREFVISSGKRKSRKINLHLKKGIFFFIKIFVKLRILNNYSDEYGLIVRIAKKL